MVALPFVCHSTMALCLCSTLGFLQEHSQLRCSSLLYPLRLSPLSQQQSPESALQTSVPAPSPHAHWQIPVSGWDVRDCGPDHLCKSHSLLHATDQLLGSPSSPHSSLSVSADLPIGEGASPDAGTSAHLKLPDRSANPVLLPLLFLFPSSFFPHTQLCGDLSCPFRFPRSSASVQQGICENCSICRCSFDTFVGRDEHHILPLLCHLGK